MSASPVRPCFLPARSFAQFVMDQDCQIHWEVNATAETLAVFLDVPLLDRLTVRLMACLKDHTFVLLSEPVSDTNPLLSWEQQLNPHTIAGLMGYAVEQAMQALDPKVMNPYLVSRLRLHHVGWMASTDQLENHKAYSAPRLFWIHDDTLMARTDDPHLDKWMAAWATLILDHLPLTKEGHVTFEGLKTWWIQAKAPIRVTQHALPDHWLVPVLSDAAGAPDAEPESLPPEVVMVTPPQHRVAKTEDFQASHPNGMDNDWCWRLIQRLDPLPLRQWSDQGLQALRQEFPWAVDALDRLELTMAFWRKIGNGIIHMPPLLLVGPAGCGKTRLAKRLGECLGLPTMMVSASGGGAQQIKGTERAWSNGTPSPVVRFMADHGCPNPLIVVDEIDKQEENRHAGTLQHALLGLVEPENARAFRDTFLEIACDLSAVNWIMTANDASLISGPLITRLDVIRVGHPRAEHLHGIAMGVRTDLAQMARCALDQLPWTAHDERWVREQMGAVFSAREARKLIEKRLMLSVTQGRPDLQVVPAGPIVALEPTVPLVPHTGATVVALHRAVPREPQA